MLPVTLPVTNILGFKLRVAVTKPAFGSRIVRDSSRHKTGSGVTPAATRLDIRMVRPRVVSSITRLGKPLIWESGILAFLVIHSSALFSFFLDSESVVLVLICTDAKATDAKARDVVYRHRRTDNSDSNDEPKQNDRQRKGCPTLGQSAHDPSRRIQE